MGVIAYVNGRYLPHARASVHVEDRGYQFSDGIYEVIAVRRGALVDAEGHMRRLDRSLREMEMTPPMSEGALRQILAEIVRRNRLIDGSVYLQVTRGVAPRDHFFPKGVKPALVITAKRLKPFKKEAYVGGIDVITVPDIRWKRRDIKTVSLLPNCLAKEQARRQGAYEAWQVEDGYVTEGTASNAWILTKDDELVTRAAGPEILNGITRLAVLDIAKRLGLKVVERPFTVDEALAAREAFITSSTSFVKPVVRIDGKAIGNGEPGSVGLALLDAYFRHLDGQA
ncbi:MAG: D-amino-acid transaminase [Rhodospirillales bacterium]